MTTGPRRRGSGSLGARLRRLAGRGGLREDAVAGLALGIESVPDGLASGLLAGVNPVAGIYAYMFGTASAALFTSTAVMAVQGTGAMAVIVADVGLDRYEDPDRALFTLTVLTGVVMVGAGLGGLGSALRFVSNSVMVGFTTAVGVNIVLGQLDTVTGYAGDGGNRVTQAVDLLLNLARIDVASVTVGVVTILLIVVLQRTRLGALGLVVAVVAGSAVAGVLRGDVQLVRDIADVPNALPPVALPSVAAVPSLVLPAMSLAFVGLVQGAGVAALHPPPDGRPADVSQDFVGQGVGNLVAGLFRGMPVGGSMSASSLVVAAGARTRLALVIAGAVMAAVVLLLADAVALVAMPALGGLLIVVGASTVKPAQITSVVRTGRTGTVVLLVTFVLTMVIPLQYAVLTGVGISVILHVVGQSNRVDTRRLVLAPSGAVRQEDPPGEVGAGEVVVLQPHGSLFFASAQTFEAQLPRVTPGSADSVVVLRLRGQSELGGTVIEVLRRYAGALTRAGSRFVVVVDDGSRTLEQLDATGALDEIGSENVYRGDAWLGAAVRRAHADAEAWVEARRSVDSPEG